MSQNRGPPFLVKSVRPLFFMYLGMVTAMDDAIGAVMAAFRKHKFMGNLIVVFTTDVSCAFQWMLFAARSLPYLCCMCCFVGNFGMTFRVQTS